MRKGKVSRKATFSLPISIIMATIEEKIFCNFHAVTLIVVYGEIIVPP